LARTQARKRIYYWLTASSISDCFKPRLTCSRRCRSSSMSWTLVSYTRCWMTNHSARHEAIELTRPQSGGLCYLVCHSANVMFLFSLGSVSTLFRWGENFCHNMFLPVYNSAKIIKNASRFSRVMITNVLPPFYGSQCICSILLVHILQKQQCVFHCKLNSELHLLHVT